MKNNNRIRTYPIKSLTIFLAISFVVSVSMLVLFSLPFMQEEMWVIKILIWVLCGLFTIASAIVLIQQLCFWIEVDDEHFYKRSIFGSQKIPFRKIDHITNIDGFYTIYVQGKKVTSFATNTKEGTEIIVFLEKHGVKIEW